MFISDPGYEYFQPGSRVEKIPGSASKNILTQKIVSKLSEIWYGPKYTSRIRIPDPDLFFKMLDLDPYRYRR